MHELETEPPLTMDLGDEDLDILIDTQMIVESKNNSQAVERMVKLVTEASQHVVSETKRDRYVISICENRAKIPNTESLKHFKI